MKTYRIIVIPGDGIGPEITAAAIDVLTVVQDRRGDFRLDVEFHNAGAAEYQRTGMSIAPETVEACRQADAVLKGPAGSADVRFADGTEAGLIGGTLRTQLDLYANVRPIKLWPGVVAPVTFPEGRVDYVIVRENTEGLYASRGRGVVNDWAASDLLFMTRPGVERICQFAFELARRRQGPASARPPCVTCVDKSNVLRSFAFFRRIFDEVGERYPDVARDYIYADSAAQALILNPDRFDVLVMENFLGDVLSDLAGATIGGIGICPAGNIGDGHTCFEPIHGSASSLAGTNSANPLGQILAAAMMLDALGEAAAATSIENAVHAALASGAVSIGSDGCPRGGTQAAVLGIVQQFA